eukprot:584136_1
MKEKVLTSDYTVMFFFLKHVEVVIPNKQTQLSLTIASASDYDLVLRDSLGVIKHTIISALISAVLYSSRATIWILYAETMHGSTLLAISFVLYASCILRAIWGILIGRLSDKIGFDAVMLILSILDCIGVLLQAVATNFVLLCIGYLIMPSSMFMVTWSYSSYLLPYKYSVQYMSWLYATYMFLLVCGPVFAGILSQMFGEYRCVFYANAIMLLLQLWYAYKFVYNTQSSLQERQEHLLSYPDDNEQFPVLITQHNKVYHARENKQFWDSFFMLPIFDRAVLFLITMSNRFLWSFEFVILTFYAPYVLKTYPDTSVLVATAQLSLMGFGLGFGNVLMPKLFPRRGLHTKYHVMLLSGLIEIFVCGYFIPFGTNVNMLWIYCLILGLSVGLHTMSLESIILDIQPKDSIAKMAMIKSVIVNILKAFNLLAIGLLTTYVSVKWLWGIICILFCLSFLASIGAVIVRNLLQTSIL